MFEVAFVALGSNLGDRRARLAQARAALSLIPGSRLAAVGSVEETAPLGGMAQDAFLNQMVALETPLAPDALLTVLHRIEGSLGRMRTSRWAPRTIDLDIVKFGGRILDTETLTLPHPGIESRDFWQREIAELNDMLERTGQ